MQTNRSIFLKYSGATKALTQNGQFWLYTVYNTALSSNKTGDFFSFMHALRL